MKHIAVVEDEPLVRGELLLLLERAEYKVTAIEDFENITGTIIDLLPDMVLLDINLPNKSGYQICRELKNKTSIPVVILTSRDQLKDEINAFETGADEFITKPYRSERLLMRISNVLRRYEGRSNMIEGKNFLLDRQTYTLYINGSSVVLPKNQGKILETLLISRGGVVTKDELNKALWGTSDFIDENALQVNLTRLKKTVSSLNLDAQIVSVRGVGYKIAEGEAG